MTPLAITNIAKLVSTSVDHMAYWKETMVF